MAADDTSFFTDIEDSSSNFFEVTRKKVLELEQLQKEIFDLEYKYYIHTNNVLDQDLFLITTINLDIIEKTVAIREVLFFLTNIVSEAEIALKSSNFELEINRNIENQIVYINSSLKSIKGKFFVELILQKFFKKAWIRTDISLLERYVQICEAEYDRLLIKNLELITPQMMSLQFKHSKAKEKIRKLNLILTS